MSDDIRHSIWMSLASFSCVLLLLVQSQTSVLPLFAPFLYTMWGVAVVFWTPRASSFWLFFVVALLLRGLCIGAELVWSDDLYRYLWEGKLVLNGGNPYLSPPSSFSVEDGIRELVNHSTIPAVYPPLAQYIFAVQSWLLYDVKSVQMLSAIADLGTATAIWVWLKKRSFQTTGAWMYALHPLPIIECAWSGHLESLAVCAMAWGLVGYNRWGKWVWFAGGWLKLFPFVYLLFVRKWKLWDIALMSLVSLVLLLPFWDPQFFQGLELYARHWSYNASLYEVLSLAVPTYARLLCASVALSLSGWLWMHWYHRNVPIEKVLLSLGMTFVLCSPTVHPWYALWVMVPMLFVQDKVNITILGLWCSLVPLTYVSIFTLDHISGKWSPPLWPTLISYLVPLVLWLWIRYRKVHP